MKAETAGLNSSFWGWFMSACNQTTSGVYYLLIGAFAWPVPFTWGALIAWWTLSEYSTRLRI